MSFGVGENPAKRVGDTFEAQLVGHVSRAGMHVLIDQGAGGEEAERVSRAIANSKVPADRVRIFSGPFGQFAAAIAKSDLYIGYDSAGQHVAAACAVPLLSIFAGYPSERFFARWRPLSAATAEVIKVQPSDPAEALTRALAFVDRQRAG
jgi:ADP-heptose:LPS heptosyltransferase